VSSGTSVGLPPPAELELRLLGGFELRGGGRVLLDRTWTRSKAKALLKLVAIEGQIHREHVLDTLWPDLDPAAAAGNLRKNLHHLRTAVAEQDARATVIAVRDDVLQLGPGVSLDIAEFRALASDALADPDPAAMDAALIRYRGDLLPEDHYEDWAAGCRAGLRGGLAGPLRRPNARRAGGGHPTPGSGCCSSCAAGRPRAGRIR
jgi:DNA-binding SARP family transcriptional activator